MSIMLKEIEHEPVAVKRCLEENTETIEKLVEAIKRENITSLFIAARGTSYHASVYAKYITEYMIGLPVSLAAPSIFTLYDGHVNLKNSLVIGVSQSGKAEDVLEVLRNANKQGALTVGITNSVGSPIATEAKYHLYCAAGEEISVAATKTFTTQMLLFATLSAYWSGNRGLMSELESLPDKISRTLEMMENINDLVKKYKDMEECFVLARGVNYAIALETALKIQETSYIRAKGFAISDFAHGPIAMIDKKIPVIIYAPEGQSLNNALSMIERLKEEDIELIIVTNSRKLSDHENNIVMIPETQNDIISPFYNAVFAQMFACKLSLARGLNPDKPRMLQKVTITR